MWGELANKKEKIPDFSREIRQILGFLRNFKVMVLLGIVHKSDRFKNYTADGLRIRVFQDQIRNVRKYELTTP